MEFTDEGRKAFAAVTKRIAAARAADHRPARAPTAIGRSSASRSRSTTRSSRWRRSTTARTPRASTAAPAPRSTGSATSRRPRTSPRACASARCRSSSSWSPRPRSRPSLGQQALDQGLLAGAVGPAADAAVPARSSTACSGRSRRSTLIIYAVFLFALVKLIPITLTLPGIAGLILTLGVAADANIVIFERIKEEARAGRSIPAAIAGGYQKALRTIIDANVVTIGVAFILFTLATAGVKGFAFTLGVGTIVSLFTAVLATSAILGAMSRTRLIGSRFALGVGQGGRPGRAGTSTSSASRSGSSRGRA